MRRPGHERPDRAEAVRSRITALRAADPGLFGAPRVNVLALNLALDALGP